MRGSLVALSLLLTPVAQAAEIGTEDILGVGVMLGSPTGVIGKFYFGGPRHAVDFGIATEFFGFGDDRATLFGTYLYQPGVLLGGGTVEIPWHVGAGVQLWTEDLDADLGDDLQDEDAAFGLRVPVGVDVNVRFLPLQFTADMAVVAPIVPDVDLGFQIFGAVRYYFL